MTNSLVEALKNGATLEVVNQEVQKAPGNAGAEAADEAKDPITKAVALSGIPSDLGKEKEREIVGGDEVSDIASPNVSLARSSVSSSVSPGSDYYKKRPTNI